MSGLINQVDENGCGYCSLDLLPYFLTTVIVVCNRDALSGVVAETEIYVSS
jgi:hypothetical protein